MNLGQGAVPRYRRCIRADVSRGAGRQVQLATSLAVMDGKLVLRGALLLPKHTCTLGTSGWVGFGLPREQGGDDMIGARVMVTQPSPAAPTGAAEQH